MKKNIYLAGNFQPGSEASASKFKTAATILVTTDDTVESVYHATGTQTWDGGIYMLPAIDQTKSVIVCMLQCDELHLLPCWSEHKGSTLLRDIATRIAMPIVYHH